jgi:hypothetical protein
MPIKLTRTDNVGEVVKMAMLAPKIKKVAAAFEKNGFDLPKDFASDFVMCLAGTYDLDNPVGGLSEEDLGNLKEDLLEFLRSRADKTLSILERVSPDPGARKARLADLINTGMTSFIEQQDPLRAGQITPEARLRIANETAADFLAIQAGVGASSGKTISNLGV